MAAPGDDRFRYIPPHFPEQKRRNFLTGRKMLALVVIFVLVIFLVGAAVNNMASPVQVGGAPVNSPTTPMNGAQLYDAYAANQTHADSAFTNKTIYIQDSLYSGVIRDSGTGEYFSPVNSGNVILIWSNQSQTVQLYQGAQVLARCMVDGLQRSQGTGYLLYLEDCDLVDVQAPATTTMISVPAANL